MEAAFAASFVSDNAPQADAPATAAAEAVADAAPQPEEVKQEAPATPPAPQIPAALSDEQIKLLSAIPELERRLTQQVDRVAGNYGEVKRLLETMQKAAATPQGAADFDASKDGDYIDREFPELAGGLKSKIDEAVSKIQSGITADQFEAMYAERRKHEELEHRNKLINVLESKHPDRFDIQKTPEWSQWRDGLTPYQRDSLENSEDPYYVSSMLSKFKDFRDKRAVADKKSKQRIEGAVSPNGVRPTSPSTITEEEAMQKAFAAALTER